MNMTIFLIDKKFSPAINSQFCNIGNFRKSNSTSVKAVSDNVEDMITRLKIRCNEFMISFQKDTPPLFIDCDNWIL
ncbi:Uncharacterized protein dnm_067450 [Desulfonema magnum]|uniref:Uncharacterized protein n=1 Tax=Desulfonema magnum TaxID=45655 RepID=A0A975BT17_9BACT|nr:Uncharacterized protein dnm_067450 [Desulfonema magnum]